MLRDLPPFDSSAINFIMNRNDNDHNELVTGEMPRSTYEDPLDDVFGSAPSSPQLGSSHQIEAREISNESGNPGSAVNGFASADPSDIPRLRTRHVTEGYREGIAASKDKYIQEGFDEGFALGAEIGLLAGSILGVLEGLVQGLQHGSVERIEVAEMLGKAEQELKMDGLISKDFFEADGNWKFEVQQDGEGVHGDGGEDFAFRDVAAAHPILKAWKAKVSDLGREYGVDAPGLR